MQEETVDGKVLALRHLFEKGTNESCEWKTRRKNPVNQPGWMTDGIKDLIPKKC